MASDPTTFKQERRDEIKNATTPDDSQIKSTGEDKPVVIPDTDKVVGPEPSPEQTLTTTGQMPPQYQDYFNNRDIGNPNYFIPPEYQGLLPPPVNNPADQVADPADGASTGTNNNIPNGDTNTGFATPDMRAETVKDMLEQTTTDPRQFLKDQGAEQVYTPIGIRDDEVLDPSKHQLDDRTDLTPEQVAAAQATASPDVKVRDYEAELLDPDDLSKAFDRIQELEPMKAASMADHMTELLEGMEEGNVPLWARPAVAKVEQALAGRGISASSIGRDSLFNAIIQSAMPIAQQDATFEQQANQTTYQANVNAIMSDVASENAAKQFNAQTINQKNQFMTQLQAQVDMSNAARKDAISQFNAAQANDVSKFNVAQSNAMAQFNDQINSQREQFNAQMGAQIEQSNVQWRRQVNTQNTAGINAVNQANAQNAFNLSTHSMSLMWQEMRDQAHWDFQATQTDKTLRNNLEASLIANEAAVGEEAGKTFADILAGVKSLSSWLDNK